MDAAQVELIARIASVVGHELRNPLAVINNSSYFVRAKLAGGGLDPKVDKHLKIIESEIARADRLIGDILAYSRKCEPLLETQPLDSIARQAVESCPVPAGGRLVFKPASGAMVRVDARLLSEALRRLVDNAFDVQAGRGAVQAATGADKKTAWVSVEDAGGGVDPKVRGSLFEPFTTTKPRGLGLGLALARKLLEAGGGSADYEPGPKGSIFRLVVPKA